MLRRALLLLLPLALVVVSATYALTASNTVPASRLSLQQVRSYPNTPAGQQQKAQDFAPPECDPIRSSLSGIRYLPAQNGTNASELILGTAGNDSITARGGNDCVVAGDGHDSVSGGSGNDVILGGPGNDSIDGGPGYDRCYGGPGTDTFSNCEVIVDIP